EIIKRGTLINSLNKQINEQNEELKKINQVKADFNKNLLTCMDNFNKNNQTLNEKEKEIQENQVEIKRKDELLKYKDQEVQEKTDQVTSKDAQNKALASQISAMSQYLTKTNEKLSKCDEISSCTTAGKGIYHIKLPGVSEFQAPCNGAGWTVIQRRMDGSVSFKRGWNEYRDGFGYLTGEFFIGLEKLHQITKSRKHELYISLGKVDGSTDFAKFDDFRIGSEKDSYPLESVGNCTGYAGDSLKAHLKMKFTTFDRDNDLHQGNCAQMNGGGWWYFSCAYSHLNGWFYKDGKMKNNLYGIFWGTWQNNDWSVSLTFVEMMIKPSQ
ncbi:hypothetical protein KR026_008550, partial [Drosophila bipectinata]